MKTTSVLLKDIYGQRGRNNMDMFDWKIIKTLYELKNITNTAKVLYISQPALTGRIKKIENQTGYDLSDPNSILEIALALRIKKFLK